MAFTPGAAYQAVIDGDDATADQILEDNWPAATYDMIRSGAAAIDAGRSATSGTSHTISTGSKTFTVSEDPQWQVGLGLFVGSPTAEGEWMWGTVTAASGTSVTIDITRLGPTTGVTRTSWGLVPMLIVIANLPSGPPVALDDGGFGLDASASPHLAADAVELLRKVEVDQIVSTLPGSPGTGDTVLFSGGGGDFDTLQRYDGAAWGAVTMREGDMIYVATLEAFCVLTDTQSSSHVFSGSKYAQLSTPKSGVRILTSSDDGTTLSNDDLVDTPKLVVSSGNSTEFSVTISDPSNAAIQGVELVVFNAGTADVTFNGNFNALSAITLSQYDVERLLSFGSNWWGRTK